MISRLLALLLLILISSCAGQSNKSHFGIVESDVGDLSFTDLKSLKESKSCADGSIGFARAFAAVITYGISELSISDYANIYTNDKYKYFASLIVDKSGDASISTATKLGGITKIRMVDHSYSITGLMGRRYCVIVYGE